MSIVLQDGGPADGCVLHDAGVWMKHRVYRELELELALGSGEYFLVSWKGWEDGVRMDKD